MIRKFVVACTALALLAPASLRAHCQIPCGIYGDETRFTIMEEHVQTIEKSMAQIAEATKEGNWNQVVRWVENKEDHADELAHIVTYYFLQQRIKPADGGDNAALRKYMTELSACHQILIHAMKAKQTTDTQHVEALRRYIHDLAHSYMGDAHKH